MAGKESFLKKLERLEMEQALEGSLKGEEFIKSRLRSEDWERLLPRLIRFAQQELERRRWRGARAGVLPEGHDANSIAAEVSARALEGKLRLAVGWTFERLEGELRRQVSHEVRRLHKREERATMRSEWDVLPRSKQNGPQSVFSRIPDTGTSGMQPDVLECQNEQQRAEERIAAALGEEDRLVRELFLCLREGVVKRREIAAKLGISVEAVTNCRKRLNRKLFCERIKYKG